MFVTLGGEIVPHPGNSRQRTAADISVFIFYSALFGGRPRRF
jgi:hypothetical protein